MRSSWSYRRLLLSAQVAQGALLRAVVDPPQNYVFGAVEGAPRQAQCTCTIHLSPGDVTTRFLTSAASCYRLVRYPFARMTRSASSGGSTKVGRARSHRCTVRSGSSTSTVCNGTSRTARRHLLASTQARSSSPASSLTRTGPFAVYNLLVHTTYDLVGGLFLTARTARRSRQQVLTLRWSTCV